MKATSIAMRIGCRNSDNLLEIDSIYIDGCKNPDFYKKEAVYDYLIKSHQEKIYVDIYPYPELVPAISSKGEKYVRSKSNSTDKDNLLKLPRR